MYFNDVTAFCEVFLFIDSPYKRRAAAQLSFWLNIKNAVETLAPPQAEWIEMFSWGQDYREVECVFLGTSWVYPQMWSMLWDVAGLVRWDYVICSTQIMLDCCFPSYCPVLAHVDMSKQAQFENVLQNDLPPTFSKHSICKIQFEGNDRE